MTMRIVVMGVSGCGKSTVGKMLASKLSAKFVDGDDLHPEENKAKMAAGIALNDDDRWGWLDSVAATLESADRVIVACSALKVVYRERIEAASPGTVFVHLSGSRSVLESRLNNRKEHFMPASLLDSQLSTLQPLGPDELGVVIDIDKSIDSIVDEALSFLKLG